MEYKLECVKFTPSFNKVLVNLIIMSLCIVLMVITPSLFSDDASSGYMLLNIIGIAGILVTFFDIIFGCKKEIYTCTGSTIRNRKIKFNAKGMSIDKITDMVSNGKIGDFKEGKDNNKYDTLIEYKESEDGQFIAYQISHYVPYQFEVAVKWIRLK